MSLLSTSIPANPAPRPKTLFGYQVIDLIGEGAGSQIYSVRHPGNGQVYALKHVVRRSDKDVRFIEQLQNEYEIGRAIAHPNLRKVVDLKENRTLLLKLVDAALVMEMVDGVSLETRLPRDMPRLVEIFIESARALHALHVAGYVHCDFKPNNILVTSSGHVKVIDLGQAAKIGTAKKRIQGTPDFIAPEQVKCLPVDPRTDVYNFGASLYWALCGQKMPTLYTAGRGKNAILSDNLIQPPRQLNPMVPEPLSAFTMECTRINPAKRPQEMSDVIRRMEIIHYAVKRDAGAAG